MKKILFLFGALCMITVASAQKITTADLQGQWRLSAIDNNGAHVNLLTEEITISPEMKAQLTPDMVNQLSDGLKQSISRLKASDVVFASNTIKQNMAGKEKKGTYALKELGDKQYAAFAWDNNTTSESSIWIKNKQLHIVKSEGGQVFEFIYSKG